MKNIQLSDKTVTMNCPTVKVVKNAMKHKDEMEMIATLISSTCNMSPEEVDNLPFPDYMILQEGLSSFLGQKAVTPAV